MKDYASPFIVENRPGASERFVLEAVKSSAANRSTLLLTGSSSMAVVPHVSRSSISIRCWILRPSRPFAVSRSCSRWARWCPLQVKTLADFISWCRANPKQATYGTVGAGSLHHFIGVALSHAAGFEFLHVPYQGLAAVQDLLAGRIAATIFPPGPSLSYVQSGELRALITTRGHSEARCFPTCRRLGNSDIQSLRRTIGSAFSCRQGRVWKPSKPSTPRSAPRSRRTMLRLA